MDRIIYDALCRYYNALENTGYLPHTQAQKLLVLCFYRDFVYHDYRAQISKADYYLIERALDCLYGSTCLIPYPDYLKMGKLHLSEVTELALRLKDIEDAKVLKLTDIISGIDGSDIQIVVDEEGEEETPPVVEMSVTPSSVRDLEDSVIHISATVDKSVILQIDKVIGTSTETIYGPIEGDSIEYDYTLSNPEAGTIKFIVTAAAQKHTVTSEATVEVQDIPQTITAFTVSPTEVTVNQVTNLRFQGSASRTGKLSILHSNGRVIAAVLDSDYIDYTYTPPFTEVGTYVYTLRTERGDKTDEATVSVEIKPIEYPFMYYGSSSIEMTTETQIKTLRTSSEATTSAIQDEPYFYIALHSSKNLISCHTTGEIQEEWKGDHLEYVIEFPMTIGGSTQMYRLYRAYTSPASIAWGVTFSLQIQIR